MAPHAGDVVAAGLALTASFFRRSRTHAATRTPAIASTSAVGTAYTGDAAIAPAYVDANATQASCIPVQCNRRHARFDIRRFTVSIEVTVIAASSTNTSAAGSAAINAIQIALTARVTTRRSRGPRTLRGYHRQDSAERIASATPATRSSDQTARSNLAPSSAA